MKKYIGIFALSFLLLACNNSANDDIANADSNMNNSAVTDTSNMNNAIEGSDISDKAQQSSVDTAKDIGISSDSTN